MTPRKVVGLTMLAAGATAVAAGLIARSRRAPASSGTAGYLGRGHMPAATETVASTSGRTGTTTTYVKARLPIRERIAILQGLVARSVKDPDMRKLALQITRDCPARDGLCEARAIYDWTRSHIRYTGDIAPHKLSNGTVEGVDLFQSAARTVEFGGGDCDDHSVLNATLLLLNGIPATLRITARNPGPAEDFGHIYSLAGLPKLRPTKLVALDTTLPGSYFGVEAPYGKKLDDIA